MVTPNLPIDTSKRVEIICEFKVEDKTNFLKKKHLKLGSNYATFIYYLPMIKV